MGGGENGRYDQRMKEPNAQADGQRNTNDGHKNAQEKNKDMQNFMISFSHCHCCP